MICHDVCPKKCIEVRRDELGHLYPKVNRQSCVDCGMCLKVCQSHTSLSLESPKQVLAAWRKDGQKRKQSSSGGLAAVVAETFICKGGVVYGCAFTVPFGFKHVRCVTLEELNALKGSKYVQSNTMGIYKQIASDLRNREKVLLIGTPCQVAAAKNLFKDSDNFFAVDLICHGVPSEKILRDSLPKGFETLQPDCVVFRTCTKYHFCAKSGISTVFSRPLEKDLFLKGFFTGLFYRDSCYICNYAQQLRVGDITLGDFWGVKLDESVINSVRGISLCLVNTFAGKELVEQVSDETIQIERSLEEAITANKQLSAPSKRTFRTKIFRYLYPKAGFKFAVVCSIPEIIAKNFLWAFFKKVTK